MSDSKVLGQVPMDGLQHSYGPEYTQSPPNAQHANLPEVVPPSSWPEAVPPSAHGDGGKIYLQGQGWVPYPHPNQQYSSSAPEVVEKSGPKKQILGLPVLWFWILAILLILSLGIGLGVGLGVGLSASHSHNESSSSSQTSSAPASDITSSSATSSVSSTISSTSSSASSSPTAVTSGTTGIAANSCNFTTPRTYTSSDDSARFLMYCFTDWYKGDEAASGNGTVQDLAYTTLYTFEDCMDYCLSYNSDLSDGDTQCRAVTYNSNLTSIVSSQGGNCFLKDKQGVNQPGSAESASAVIAL